VLKKMTSNALALTLLVALASAAGMTALRAADEPKPETPAAATAAPAAAGETKAPDAGAAPPAAPAAAPAGGAMGTMTPADRIKVSEKGTLKNPFTGDAKAIEEGHKIYMGNSCNGCHGGGGGGGMCPPLTNQIWVYGSDDDTLFRLITLGSKDLQAAGYKRKGSENVVGPMPPYHDIITKEEDLWKIIAWIRSIWTHGDARKNW
jgi:mono/diheme cytochrome c family protein